MDMEDYDRVVKDTYETELDNRVAFLRSLTVPIFNGFSTRQLYELAKCLEKKYFRHNQGISSLVNVLQFSNYKTTSSRELYVFYTRR